jgi:hypothetical protein
VTSRQLSRLQEKKHADLRKKIYMKKYTKPSLMGLGLLRVISKFSGSTCPVPLIDERCYDI